MTRRRIAKPCAIASNSFEDDIRVILDRAGFPDPPCAVVGRRKGLRTKPAPDIFVYTAGLLGAECHAAELLGPHTHETEDPTPGPAGPNCLHPHRFIEQRAGQDLSFLEVRRVFRHE